MNRVFLRVFLIFVPVFVLYSCKLKDEIHEQIQVSLDIGRYELCPTDDNSIFLSLDTSNGQIWVVSLGDGNKRIRFTFTDKVAGGNLDVDGRFSIKATGAHNIFLLFDSSTGNCWQVKWDLDKDKRYVAPIKTDSRHATLLEYN